MQPTQWDGYASRQVGTLPKLDRFFPDCALGLVEFLAQAKWGLRDLKKIWFGNTFEYRTQGDVPRLAPNQIELDARIALAGNVRGEAFEKLAAHYGIEVENRAVAHFSELLAEVHACLGRGLPAITSIDMSLLQGERRAKGLFQPHMVAAVGWNSSDQTLSIVDQVRGQMLLPLADYEESFVKFRERNHDVVVLECTRSAERDLPLRRAQVRCEVRAAVDNLFSPSPGLGLAALSELARDVAAAAEAERRPFAIPGLWIFSHDRHALKVALPHWREAEVADEATLARLQEALGSAFAQWFQIDMDIERSLYEQDAARMHKVARGLQAIRGVEEEIAHILRHVASSDDCLER